jgi:hypothetical protein
MTIRRAFVLFAVLCAWLATIPSAGAHRVDEYLQATRLSIGIDRVDLEMDLTAGIALASEVFGWMDTNRDGEISSAEGEAYARQVLRSVVLKAYVRPMVITLVETSVPEFREMNLGVGTIRLRATARIPISAAGHHQVSFLNADKPESSVYLVNALVPENPRIQITDQRRDVAQHGLMLDYAVVADSTTPSSRTFALFAGLVMAGCLFLRCAFTLRHAAARSRRRNRLLKYC